MCCFIIHIFICCLLVFVALVEFTSWFSDGRLQPGTVSFNAIVTAYGRLSEWQRSLDVAWLCKNLRCISPGASQN